ncbi:hypothetical protein ABEB36_002608 [Hypothenemus hampei]|uniref:USP8 dimerisation domain-containing protein n=1 Tax=Hypothenemus hampei TaxID=57062 RepID=A0ABD1F6C9_HYPHA
MAVYVDRQLCAKQRFQYLLDFSGRVEIDLNVNAKLYYKSGLNMYRQFNIYYNQSSWENAFCIYLKYEKLFCDKIRQHPEFARIPVGVKSMNAVNLRIIKSKAEHAKRELLKLYHNNYVIYVEELKAKKRRELSENNKIGRSAK